MKSFTDYIAIREENDLGTSSLGDTQEPELNSLVKIARIAWDRYRVEARQFFQGLAHKDPEVKEELDRLQSDASGIPRPKKDGDTGKEPELIAPPESDQGTGEGEGGD